MQVAWCQHHQEVADRDLSGVLLGTQNFLNEHLGSHWLGSSKSRSVLQTQVLSNDQPDSYVIGKNPAINHKETSCLLVLLAFVGPSKWSGLSVDFSLLSSWDTDSMEVSAVFVLQTKKHFVCKISVAYFNHNRFVSDYWLQIYRYRWLTTASGYMRLLFDTKMADSQKSKLL